MIDHIETRAFYSTEAQGNPNTQRYEPGEQAFHAWAKGEHAALMERDAAERRPEIGRVEQRTGRHGAWVTVYERLTPEEMRAKFIQHWNEAIAAHSAGKERDARNERHKEYCRAGAFAYRAMEVMPRVLRQGASSLAIELVRQHTPAEQAFAQILGAAEALAA